ncbi:Cobalt-precorrin-6x reductase [gamma proteobacterium IMCC2047]|nr:Cobalt-precorrin-6x reductase [gamma proteobacterium IMCC2047]
MVKRLNRPEIETVYSVAGLVRMPDVDCEVISGGFSQFGGLQTYIKQQQIDAVLDATHPYAQNMTATASAVTRELNIPYWRFHRAPWQAQEGDHWQQFDSWDALLARLKGFQSVFLTAGQLDEAVVSVLDHYGKQGQKQLLRTAVQPSHDLPPSMRWVKAIGPFDLENERALMREHQVDVLVSKNSGGKATEAKLAAAREMGIPVLMLKRPELPADITVFDELDECVEAVCHLITK